MEKSSTTVYKQLLLFIQTSILLIILCSGNFSCKTDTSKKESTPGNSLFKLLTPGQTHISFANTLTEGVNTNVLMYQYFYNGGGVAVGDLNGDHLQDIYFTGNMTDNKLYINQGKMQFKDVTETAGVAGRPGPWKTGVTMVDINGDNKLDIYICYSGKLRDEKRINQLFINQGNDTNGVPQFKEMSADYGLNFPSFSTQAYFFDYDRDGDLDLLLLNHNIERLNIIDEVSVKELMSRSDLQSGLRLFENEKGRFRDITAQTGITNSPLSYGLAAGIADINNDGWPDIYISNDYSVPDRLYINNGKGKFTDVLPSQIGHSSFYSMGNDIADINNDMAPDIYTLDMLPEDNRRQKLLFGADNYESFNLNLRVGFYYQYMRNMLHVNNANGTFSEVGQMAGISNTDWSWAPLFADYDNDGWKDLFVSNGYTRDYTNMDFLKYMGDNLRDRSVMRKDLLELVQKIPSSEVKSYFFRNNGNLGFADSSSSWGITESSNSNGAAYADLDNDGDLDLIVNNVNKPAFVYENETTQRGNHHFLAVSLKGNAGNTQGIGAKIIIYAKNKSQYIEQMPTRGFQSSVSPIVHFGLGEEDIVDSLRVIWQRGNTQLLKQVNADQTITLDEQQSNVVYHSRTIPRPLFIETISPINHIQPSNSINDFKRQPLLLNPLSFSGPCMAKADVNGDALEDVFIGGENGKPGSLYLQQKNGQFHLKNIEAFDAGKNSNDVSAIFFDANADGKQDLYVCSGGYNDFVPGDPLLQDRLYINNGKGDFVVQKNALPVMLSSKSCVRAADINGDGYLDLFVGGRVIPGRYPETPESYILINNGKGVFADETERYNPAIKSIGMVTDAAWVDMNNDKKPDLVIVGEWMPITVFINQGKLVDQTNLYFDKKYAGWWNCIYVSDLNKDGRPDLIVGNLGLNSQCKATDAEPAEMYYKDFDNNGSVDPLLCMYTQHKTYPYVTRDELLDQISMMRGRFPDYKSYADAGLDKIFTPDELEGAKHLTANYFSTACFVSDAKGKLRNKPLPVQAQYSPVCTINTLDYDHDGNTDLLLCGNINQQRLRFGKYDANYGILLKGNGKGQFDYIPQQQSGFQLSGDVRSVLQLNDLLLFGINQKEIKAYKPTNHQ